MREWRRRLLATISPEVRQLRDDVVMLAADLAEARMRYQDAVRIADLLKRTNVELASKLEKCEMLNAAGKEGTSNE